MKVAVEKAQMTSQAGVQGGGPVKASDSRGVCNPLHRVSFQASESSRTWWTHVASGVRTLDGIPALPCTRSLTLKQNDSTSQDFDILIYTMEIIKVSTLQDGSVDK